MHPAYVGSLSVSQAHMLLFYRWMKWLVYGSNWVKEARKQRDWRKLLALYLSTIFLEVPNLSVLSWFRTSESMEQIFHELWFIKEKVKRGIPVDRRLIVMVETWSTKRAFLFKSKLSELSRLLPIPFIPLQQNRCHVYERYSRAAFLFVWYEWEELYVYGWRAKKLIKEVFHLV